MSSKDKLTLQEYYRLVENLAFADGYSASLVAKFAFDIELKYNDNATVEQAYVEVF